MQTSALLTLLLWLATAQSRPSAMTGFDSALQNVKIGVIYLTSLANRMLGYVDPEETPVTIQAIQDGPVPTTESPLAVRRLDIDYDGEDTPVNVDAVQDSSKTELSPQATESPLASRLLDSDNDAEVTPADVIVQERSTTGLPDSGMGLLPPEVNYRQDPDHILTDGHDFSLRGLPINERISPDYDPYSIGRGKREAPDYEEKNENFSQRGLPINERINPDYDPSSIGLGKREAPDYEEKNENTEIRRRSIDEDDDEEDDDDFNEFNPTLVEGGPAQGRGSRSLTMLLLPLVAQHLVPLAAHVGLAALGGAANMAASLATSYFNTTAGVTTAANAADSLPQGV